MINIYYEWGDLMERATSLREAGQITGLSHTSVRSRINNPLMGGGKCGYKFFTDDSRGHAIRLVWQLYNEVKATAEPTSGQVWALQKALKEFV